VKQNHLTFIPPGHKKLVCRKLEHEHLIYDPETNKAHCLNSTATSIWLLCDGKKTVGEIVHTFNLQNTTPIDIRIVWLTLHKLNKASLLQGKNRNYIDKHLLTRRETLRRLGSAALVALPIITTIMVPESAEAISCLPCGTLFCGGAMPCCAPCHCQVQGVNLICL
jgi:hypothetical protein